MNKTEPYILDAVDEICKMITDCDDSDEARVKAVVTTAIDAAVVNLRDENVKLARMLYTERKNAKEAK